MKDLPKTVHDCLGPLKLLAKASGYVMCRRPGSMPFVMPVKVWRAVSKSDGSKPYGMIWRELRGVP